MEHDVPSSGSGRVLYLKARRSIVLFGSRSLKQYLLDSNRWKICWWSMSHCGMSPVCREREVLCTADERYIISFSGQSPTIRDVGYERMVFYVHDLSLREWGQCRFENSPKVPSIYSGTMVGSKDQWE